MDRAELRIEKALAELGSEYHPPPGWEARVLAATRRPRRRRWVVAGSLVAAAAVVLVWWAVRDRSSPDGTLRVAFTSEVGETMRGDAVRVGSSVKAIAPTGRYRAVWIYRDGELLLACPGPSACTLKGDDLVATMPLDRIGDYHIVGLAHDNPLPSPRGDYDSDVAGAQESGARVDVRRQTVR